MKHYLLPTLIMTVAASAASAGTLFVDASLNAGMDDGSSWANAFQGSAGLQAALAVSVSGDQIFVAQGTYHPGPVGSPEDSFYLQEGVQIYGSFLGTEVGPGQRPAFGVAPSIMQGDLNGDDAGGLFDDNSFHVVMGVNVGGSAVLDGFVVSGGNAVGPGQYGNFGGGIMCMNGARPTIRNCNFLDNRAAQGGALYATENAEPKFTDCTFERNQAGSGGAARLREAGAVKFNRCTFRSNVAGVGGAITIQENPLSLAEITNCLFTLNSGGNAGGAIYLSFNEYAFVRITNCTIVGNSTSDTTGGGIMSDGGSGEVRNCIVWGNDTSNGQQAPRTQISGNLFAQFCLLGDGTVGFGNLASDPRFMDTAGGDLRLALDSPAIDAGENSSVLAGGTPLDLDRLARFVDEPDVIDTGDGPGPIVDMGAYESSLVVTSNFCQVSPNSAGPGAVIAHTGSTSITANGFGLETTGVVPGAFGLYFYGANEIQAPFGDGVRCVGAGPGGTFRLYPLVQADGSGTSTRALDFSNPPANAGPGTILPGSTWKFQLWFRDGPAGGAGFTTSDGLSATFAP